MLSIIKDHYNTFKNVHLTQDQPISLVHFVTNRCNARCSFCFIDFDDPTVFAHELTTAEIEKLTSNIGRSLKNINITGGEPFARKDLSDILNFYYSNTNIRSAFITTNGSLPDRVEKLCIEKDKNFSDRLLFFQISIDALPAEHNRIRKINGLFEKAIESYRIATKFSPHIQASIAITISSENYKLANDVYDYLTTKHKVKNIALNVVRDEGIYKVPVDEKESILATYSALSKRIENDRISGLLNNWDEKSIQGRLMNKKNEIWRDVLQEIYIKPKYIVPCMAGSIFGIIEANGKVKPCEILDSSVGNLRDYDMDFKKLWQSSKALEIKKWVKDTKCNCHYDCAWSFNILAGKKFQTRLLPSIFKF